MKWDSEKRRYTDDSGRVLTKAQVRKRIQEFIVHEQREVERQSEKLFIGALSVAAFFEYLRHKITAWHSVAGSTAYGGPDEMSGEQWSRINSKILSELAFLSKFEVEAQVSFQTANAIAAQVVGSLGQKIPAGLESLVGERVAQAIARAAPSEAAAVARQVVAETLADSLGVEAATIAEAVEVAGADSLIGGTIPSRAQMYTDAAYSTYENNVAARETDAGAVGVRRVCEEDEASCDQCVDAASDEYVSFEEVADIGSLACMCITTPHSRVLTDDGWIPIISVRPNMNVWTHQSRWRRVLSVTMRTSLPLHEFAEVQAPTGIKVGFTADHRLLTAQGWEQIKTIELKQLSVYHWQYETLQMWSALTRKLEGIVMPPMCEEMPLWKAEGSPCERVPFVRNESQGKGSMGDSKSTTQDVESDPCVERITKTALRRHSMGFKVATASRRWPNENSLLGRRSEAPYLSLSMGLDQGQRADSEGLFGASQEREPDVRLSLESGNQNQKCPFKASRSWARRQSEGEVAANEMFDLPNCNNTAEAFSYKIPQILLTGMRKDAIQLWDLEVADDHSFIVEGIVAHNSNCRCSYEFNYEGVEPLTIDRGLTDDR